ncbi:hypothetical protein IKG38_01945 [Candidatus Saccharibacteria bacterium]|nr:hypothetical protein [Candidatus Saccharibacteria bacterium]
MMIKRISKIVAVLSVLLFPFVGMSNTFADMDGMDTVMTISPPSQRIVLTPGEDFNGSVTVSSSSTAKNGLKYSVTVGAFSLGTDEDGNVDYNDVDVDTVTGYNQIMEWIELKKEQGEVEIGGTDTIPFTIHVPENAPAGGQYATIIVQNDTGLDNTGGKGVSIESKVRFASNIFAEVTGDTEAKGSIIENNIPSFILSNQLSATSVVKNDGNVHTDADYILQVWPLFGDEELYTNEEKPDTNLVMPGTERYHSKTVTTPSIGVFRVKQTIKVFGETSVVEKTVIVCPLWLLFIILFVIIGLIIWVFMKYKKKSKRND